jgi:hypothetical protein
VAYTLTWLAEMQFTFIPLSGMLAVACKIDVKATIQPTLSQSDETAVDSVEKPLCARSAVAGKIFQLKDFEGGGFVQIRGQSVRSEMGVG